MIEFTQSRDKVYRATVTVEHRLTRKDAAALLIVAALRGVPAPDRFGYGKDGQLGVRLHRRFETDPERGTIMALITRQLHDNASLAEDWERLLEERSFMLDDKEPPAAEIWAWAMRQVRRL